MFLSSLHTERYLQVFFSQTRERRSNMNYGSMGLADYLIVGAYLILMVLVGIISSRHVKGTEDYFVADRSFGPLVLMATVCATIIGGSGLMGRAGVAYSDGTKAIITAIPYLLGMFIFSGISGRISRIGTKYSIHSIPDLFERRFGKPAKIILAAMIAFTMMGTVASQVTATATILKMVGEGIGISYGVGALIATIIFISYTATSGLFGVVFTDVLQFYMLLIFVYILIPTASVHYVGGFSEFIQNIDPSLTAFRMNGSILGDIVTYLVFTLAGAEMWQRSFAAKDPKSAKKGMFLGTAVYGVTIFLVYLMGVIGHQVLGDNVLADFGSTDAVVPALAIKVLPVGLTGLAMAGIISVIMSTADSYLLISVQACVHDIGKTVKPDMDEKKEMKLSRVFSVFLALGALIIALYIKNAYNVLMFAWAFYAASAGLPAFAALYWRKATSQGIIAGMLAGFFVCVGWRLAGLPFGIGATVPGTIACAVVLVAVSLATYQKKPSVFLEA